MVVLLYEQEDNLVNPELEFAKKVSDIESLYHSFEELKLMLGTEDVILLNINLLNIFLYFPFDRYFLTGAPIGIAPSTFVNTDKEKTITWTDFINLNNLLKNHKEKVKEPEGESDDDEFNS